MIDKAPYDAVVDRILERVGSRLVVGLPLGLGKPNRLINALYRRVRADPSLELEIVTALSLDIPEPAHWLEARLMEPIIRRLYGADYPRLAWLEDLEEVGLPDNIRVNEFYFTSGAALGKPALQRHYIASNYTHVARDLVDRGVNVILQLVARDPHGEFSLSCNSDVTLDLARRLQDHGEPVCMIAQVHPELPFMHGDARVDRSFFDEIVDTSPDQPLFALPRQRVSIQDFAVGMHAARLIADDGTLQIGIGSLSDALVHSLILRHRDNATYRQVVTALDRPVPPGIGDDAPFQQGLFGASEMFMDGFMHLYTAGILKREPDGDGVVMEGGFFLGSTAFYDFLNDLEDSERARFHMHGVERINQLYGDDLAHRVEQRRRARFLNTCMMMTATGAAVSDGLADHQVVSGVGGQYNFVAMAHALEDGRSVLMLRATREKGNDTSSNVVWEYAYNTIPRHLRDLVVTEYGVADLRGKTDEQCIQAMIAISDARFQAGLAEQARAAGKLDPKWQIPAAARENTPAALAAALQPFVDAGHFPDYPFGSDLTEIEQRLVPALRRLQGSNKRQLARLVWFGRPAQEVETLARLGLDHPQNLGEWFYARLVAGSLWTPP